MNPVLQFPAVQYVILDPVRWRLVVPEAARTQWEVILDRLTCPLGPSAGEWDDSWDQWGIQ